MTALFVILILLALVFGIGAVLEGVLWAILIAVVLAAGAAWLGVRRLRAT